jgi:hypothetical protein
MQRNSIHGQGFSFGKPHYKANTIWLEIAFHHRISRCMCEKSPFTGRDSTPVLQRGKALEWATGPGIRPKCPSSQGFTVATVKVYQGGCRFTLVEAESNPEFFLACFPSMGFTNGTHGKLYLGS